MEAFRNEASGITWEKHVEKKDRPLQSPDIQQSLNFDLTGHDYLQKLLHHLGVATEPAGSLGALKNTWTENIKEHGPPLFSSRVIICSPDNDLYWAARKLMVEA